MWCFYVVGVCSVGVFVACGVMFVYVCVGVCLCEMCVCLWCVWFVW